MTARAGAKRVAPGTRHKIDTSPESAKLRVRISAFQASISSAVVNQGRRASRLPLAFIFRAFGAANSNQSVLHRRRLLDHTDQTIHLSCIVWSEQIVIKLEATFAGGLVFGSTVTWLLSLAGLITYHTAGHDFIGRGINSIPIKSVD